MAYTWLTWALSLIALGILGIAITQIRKKTKPKTRKLFMWIGLPMILLGVISMMGIWPALSGINQPIPFAAGLAAGDVVDEIPDQRTPGGICAVEDTTVTLSAIDKHTSLSTSGTHRYRVNGAPALTVSDAGSFTASPGDLVSILFMNGSAMDNYFGAVLETTIPCSGTKTFSAELGRNKTAITLQIFNEEGDLITDADTASVNETLAVGDVITLDAKIKNVYEGSLPYGGVLVVEFNGTGSASEINDVIIAFPGSSETNVPSLYQIEWGIHSRTKGYSIPAMESNEVLTGTITIKADDVVEPTAQDPDIRFAFFPNNYYIDENLGGAFAGPATEDEDDAATMAYSYYFNMSID